MDIHQNLKTLRQASGLTQQQAADRVGLTRQAISNYERGRTRPDVELLARLAEAYGADLPAVLYGCSREQRLLRAGESVVVGGGQLHSYRLSAPGRPCLCPNIVFSEEVLAPLTGTVFQKYLRPLLSGPAISHVILSPLVPWQAEASRALFEVYGLLCGQPSILPPCPACPAVRPESSPCPELVVQQRLLQLFTLLYLRREELGRTPARRSGHRTQIRMQQMVRFIRCHYAEPLTLEQVAAAAGISRSEAGRCFQKYYRQSPMHYLLQCRLNAAQKLLQDDAIPVQEVAARCGFIDSSYFIKVFQKHLNLTPAAYRRRQAEKRKP